MLNAHPGPDNSRGSVQSSGLRGVTGTNLVQADSHHLRRMGSHPPESVYETTALNGPATRPARLKALRICCNPCVKL
jgi:hypothetical protein